MAFGMSSPAAASSGSDTGRPPTGRSRRRPERASSVASRSSAVATTLVSAAGERNTTVASTAAAAAATAVAVRVRGDVTSMSGVTRVAPRAGPSRANGAKPATRPVPGPMSYCSASASRQTAVSWPWRYTTPLAGPVEPDVNRIAATVVGPRASGSSALAAMAARPRAAIVGERVRRRRGAARVDAGSRRVVEILLAGPAERAGRREPGQGADEVVGPGAAARRG